MPRPRVSQRTHYNNTNSGSCLINSDGSGSRFAILNDFARDCRLDAPTCKKDRSITRRVSFKPSQLHSKTNLKGRTSELAIRTHLEDDEDMDGFTSSSLLDDRSSRPTLRRKGSPIPKGKFGRNRNLMPSKIGWYQITVQCGQRYPKDDLIRSIMMKIAPNTFTPHYWHTDKHGVFFFVDDYAIAQLLQEQQIYMRDGFRLAFRVKAGCPNVTIDDSYKEKMKLVMAKRYNPQTKALDLSKFHADPDFSNMFCGLFRSSIMSAAIDIIHKNIPDLEAINLNDNNLSTMDSFRNIERRIPNLKILYLGNNNLSTLMQLIVFNKVDIVELVLKSNPFRQRYKDDNHFVSEVRRKFPKLQKLDGEVLPTQIQFDVTDSNSLPTPRASFLCDTNGTNIIRQFIEQYFMIFDSDNRQPLLDAYHETSMLSISVPPASHAGRLQSFWKLNRNFRRTINNDDSFKARQLKFGRLSVVSTLADWPKTQHDPQSFVVDLTLFTPKLISFTVGGLFKEFPTNPDSNISPDGEIRFFERHFIIVPAGSGFCIRNEMIFINSATTAQLKSFLKPLPTILPPTTKMNNAVTFPNSTLNSTVGTFNNNNNSTIQSNMNIAGTSSSLQNRLQLQQSASSMNCTDAASTSVAPNVAALMNVNSNATQFPAQASGSQTQITASNANALNNDAAKMQLVQALSAQSNMNLDWSRKCLEETNWDYNHATFVFDKLHKESKIPPEAFIK